MRIIVEGPDNVGKSTQINKIRQYIFNKYNIPLVYTHSSFIDVKDYQKFAKYEYYQWFEFKRVIADRLHLGERVYGRIYRGYTDDDLEYLNKLENDNQDVILIVLIDNAENLIKRDDGLSFTINFEEKEKEIELFKRAFEDSKFKRKKIININKLNEDSVFEIIKNFIEFCYNEN